MKKRADVESAGLLVNVEAVAKLLGCSVRHVIRMSQNNQMPKPIRLRGTAQQRGTIRWSRVAILEWIERGCGPVDGGDQ